MNAIYLDELLAAQSYAAVSNLSLDVTETNNIKGILNEFVTDSQGRLQGDSWTEVQAKMAEFSAVFDKRISLANDLTTAVNDALNMLVEYIGDYPYLDYSEYEEISTSYHQCELDIASINAALAETVYVKVGENDDGSDKMDYVHKIQDEGVRKQLSGKIGEIEASMAEIKALLDKLDGLEEVYNSAKELLDAAFEEFDDFETSVSQITPSSKVEYIPAQ